VRTWTVPGYTEVRSAEVATVDGCLVMATHGGTGVRVTIRYLAEERRRDEGWLARYRDKARRLADLDSPYVVGLYEYVEATDGAATVEEYVDGVALAPLLATGRLGPEPVLTVLKGVLLGLVAADTVGASGGFVASEVLIDRAGHVKLAGGFGTDTTTDEAVRPLADAAAAAFVALRAFLPDRLPKPLRELGSAGDVDALLAGLDAAAVAAWGSGWEATGREQLARAVARVAGRPAPGRENG
jgi:hypothetical protein